MATEIAFSTSVDVGEGAKSLRSLKQEFKDTQKELDGLTAGSEKYVQTLSKLGKIKDDIGDLNAEIAAFSPEGKVQAFGTVVNGVASGFQAATGAAALFGGENKELEKTLVKLQSVMAFTEGLKGLASLGDGFKVLGNVIKANPIFLIVGIVASVGAALFALKDKVGILGDAFDFLGDIIGTVVQGLKDFTDWIGITSFESDELADKQIANAKKVGQATSDRYDLEIAKAQAAGKTTFELEKQKQEAIIKTLRVEAEAIVAAARARGKFTDEENARFTELIALTQKAANDIVIIDIKANKERSDEQEKLTAKYKTENDKRKTDYQKHIDDIRKLNREAAEQFAVDMAEQTELEKKQAEEKGDAETANYIANNLAKMDSDKLRSETDKKNAEDVEKAKYSIAEASNRSLQSLSDIYFAFKLSTLKKGSAEEEAAAKRQFQINKTLSAASTTISTIQGVQNALSAPSTVPEPFGTALKIANAISVGLSGAASVAKILSTQFNSGGGTIPTINAPSSASAPLINAPSNSTTSINPDGSIAGQQNPQPLIIQNHIVESEITNAQQHVAMIQQSAQIE